MEAVEAFAKCSNENDQDGTELGASSQEKSKDPGSADDSDKDASVTTDVPFLNSPPKYESETPAEQMTGDSNEILMSSGMKRKWIDTARSMSPTPDISVSETSPSNRSGAWKTYQRTRRPPKGGCPPRSNSTPSIVPRDAIQEVPSPHFSRNVHTSPQLQSPQSLVHAAVFYSPASGNTSDQASLANKYPAIASRKPPSPPQRAPCSPRVTGSKGVKHSVPGDFTSPSSLAWKSQARQKRPSYLKSSVSLTNQTIQSPLAVFQSQSPVQNPSARGHIMSGNSASHLSCSPCFPGPEVVPSENTELLNGLHEDKSGGTAAPEQKKRTDHKRKLRQLQTQMCKKLKTWGLKSHLLQDVDGDEANSTDQKRLVIIEAQRDAFVKNMVDSCCKDPQMRAIFLDAVKQLADVGVLQTSACHLLAQGPCDASQGVVKAWKKMISHQESPSTAVKLYKAVDMLHKQGKIAMQKLLPPKDMSVCSIVNTSDGAWEVKIPDPRKKDLKGKEKYDREGRLSVYTRKK